MSDETTKRSPLEWAIVLMALSFFIAVLFQTVQLIREHGNLNAIVLNQESSVQDVLKLRDEVNSIAGDTAQLAQDGNAAAKQVVEDLGRQRINIHPPSPPSSPQGDAAKP